jgi:thiol-disulfide isomerase/thioredoxin
MKWRIESKRKKETLIGAIIVVGIIVAALGGGWYLLQSKRETQQSHPGILAQDFLLNDINGSTFRLSEFRGKVVVIDFMATWCGPCRQEMPHFGVIWGKYQGKMVLMSIDVDPGESAETVRSFAQEFSYSTWIWGRDPANLGEVYQVSAIPKTVIIDQDGYVRFTHAGVTDSSTFIQEIDQLLR